MVRWMLGKDYIQDGKSQCMCIGTLVQRKEHSYHSYRPHLFILPSLVPYVSQWRTVAFLVHEKSVWGAGAHHLMRS